MSFPRDDGPTEYAVSQISRTCSMRVKLMKLVWTFFSIATILAWQNISNDKRLFFSLHWMWMIDVRVEFFVCNTIRTELIRTCQRLRTHALWTIPLNSKVERSFIWSMHWTQIHGPQMLWNAKNTIIIYVDMTTTTARADGDEHSTRVYWFLLIYLKIVDSPCCLRLLALLKMMTSMAMITKAR